MSVEKINQEIYRQKGYKNRRDYLMQLSLDYGIPYDMVRTAADTLGPNEDFDGLPALLEEWEG